MSSYNSLNREHYFLRIDQKEYGDKDTYSKNLDDGQLWLEFQSGSEAAYAIIYKNNAPLLYKYGLKLVKDKSLIMDCIQDLFVEIWDSKQKLGRVKSIKSYLFKSIRRKLISESKKRGLESRLTQDADFNQKVNPSIEQRLIEKQRFDEQQRELKKALGKLTDRQKEIIYLKYHAQLSYGEIAEIMSINIKGAYKLMGRSIAFLREQIILILLLSIHFFL